MFNSEHCGKRLVMSRRITSCSQLPLQKTFHFPIRRRQERKLFQLPKSPVFMMKSSNFPMAMKQLLENVGCHCPEAKGSEFQLPGQFSGIQKSSSLMMPFQQ